MNALKKFTPLAMAAIMCFAACKKDDSQAPAPANNPGNPSANQPQPGTFNVKMTDAPGDYKALNITVLQVDAYLEGKGWVTLDNRARSMNVASLTNGAETQIASQTQAQAGTYSRLRVKFDTEASLELNSFAMVDVEPVTIIAGTLVRAEWDGPREMEIAINEQVSAQAGAEVLLDFDVANSVIYNARRYYVNPVMKEIRDAGTGVRGEVHGAANAAVVITDGTNTFSTYINAEGHFMMRGVKAGTYKMIIHPARKATNIMPEPKQVEGVMIVQGEIRQMGRIDV